jgi:hypothetical protein
MPTNKQIFSEQIFDLPINIKGDYLSNIAAVFETFKKQIRLFDGDVKTELVPSLALIDDQCNSILKSVEIYLRGFPGESYQILKECLDKLKSSDKLEIQQNLNVAEKQNLYRVRVAPNQSLSKEGLFHIPYQFREKVATQRYSIPGLPCLYLGDSLFVCWEEMGRPDFNEIHASRFDLTMSGFKLLNLNINTSEIRERCFKASASGKFVKHLIGFLSYWPLLAACSFVVQKPTEVFKPEYIIPQLVLQWVVSVEEVDGLKYKSNRIKSGAQNVGSFTNIVIPVKEIASTGYCSTLLKKIKMTSPVSWTILEVTDPKRGFLNGIKQDLDPETLRRASFIEIINGEQTIYSESKFGLLEEKLKTMHPSFITV